MQNFFEENRVRALFRNCPFETIPSTIDGKDIFSPITSENDVFKPDTLITFSKGKNVYDFYYNRLQMHIVNTDGVFSVEIYVSGLDDEWMNKWGDGIDSPTAVKFKVYTYCKQRLLTGRYTDDEEYVPGSWNRYVRENFKKMFDCIEDCKDCVKFDKLYKTIA